MRDRQDTSRRLETGGLSSLDTAGPTAPNAVGVLVPQVRSTF